jgi:hypothetical protein
MPPARLPALSSPAVVETEEEQSVLDAPAPALAADEAAGADAVVVGDCVAAFEVSPGNCTAVWGLIDEAPLVPPSDPVAVADPPDSGIVDVGKLNGSVAIVPVEPIWVTWVSWVSWACAAAKAASHSIVAKMNDRFIVPSEVVDGERGSLCRVPSRFHRLSVMARPAYARADLEKEHYVLAGSPILSWVWVSKSEASWRSCNWLAGSPEMRLTMRPRFTAGRLAMASVQRCTFL